MFNLFFFIRGFPLDLHIYYITFHWICQCLIIKIHKKLIILIKSSYLSAILFIMKGQYFLYYLHSILTATVSAQLPFLLYIIHFLCQFVNTLLLKFIKSSYFKIIISIYENMSNCSYVVISHIKIRTYVHNLTTFLLTLTVT